LDGVDEVNTQPLEGKLRFGLDVVATLAALGGCVFLVWLNWGRLFPPERPVPKAQVSLLGATLRGSSTSPVVLIEYSDYMCPFCARFEVDVLPQLAIRYIDTGRVQWAFKHHPLERLHPGATKTAEAALCAGREGKFWPMHAALFQNPKGLDQSRLIALARTLDVNEEAFVGCLAGQVSEQVKKDVAEAEALGLSGTPAFLVGRRLVDGTVRPVAVVDGARPLADFERAISRALRPQWSTRAVLAGGGAIMFVALWLGLRRRRFRRTWTNERRQHNEDAA
jgi:protein-disulfide isomerase